MPPAGLNRAGTSLRGAVLALPRSSAETVHSPARDPSRAMRGIARHATLRDQVMAGPAGPADSCILPNNAGLRPSTFTMRGELMHAYPQTPKL